MASRGERIGMQDSNRFISGKRRFSIVDFIKNIRPPSKILSKRKLANRNLIDFHIDVVNKIDEMIENEKKLNDLEPLFEDHQICPPLVEPRDPLNRNIEITEFQPQIRLPEKEIIDTNVKSAKMDNFLLNKEEKTFTSFLLKRDSSKEKRDISNGLSKLRKELEKTRLELEKKKKELEEIEKLAKKKEEELKLKARERRLKEKEEKKKKKELEKQKRLEAKRLLKEKKLEEKRLLKEKKLAEKNKLKKEKIKESKAGEVEEKVLEYKPVESDWDEEVRQALVIIDKLLENLPEETIDKFVQSEDFAIYERVMNKYLKRE